jgi:prevent-host-death family protein
MAATVGIRALQQNASAIVRRAAAGEIVEITDRGRAVALLVPLASDNVAAMVAAGVVRPARLAVRDLPEPLPAGSGQSLTSILAEQRADER